MSKHKWFRMCDQWRKMLVAIYYDAAAVSEEIAAALFYFPESSRLQCVFPPLHWLWMIYEVKIRIHIVPDRILWIGQMQSSPHFWSPYLRFHPLASYVWEVAVSLIIHGDIRQAIIVRSKPTNKPQPDASTSESKHDLLFRLPHPAKSSNHHRQLV